MNIGARKKIFIIFAGCAFIILGLFFSTETASAGAVANIISPVIFNIIAPIDPILATGLIIDYNSCEINIIWGCNSGSSSANTLTSCVGCECDNSCGGPNCVGCECDNSCGSCVGCECDNSCGSCVGCECDNSCGSGPIGPIGPRPPSPRPPSPPPPSPPPTCPPSTSYGGWSDCNAACHGHGSQSRSVSGNNSDCSTFSYTDTQSCYVSCPPACSFSANPSTIVLPQTSTLSWSCQYAEYGCSINNEIGSVSPISGSVEVSPPKTTIYTLGCNGIDGSGAWNATVTNGFDPTIKEVIPR